MSDFFLPNISATELDTKPDTMWDSNHTLAANWKKMGTTLSMVYERQTEILISSHFEHIDRQTN